MRKITTLVCAVAMSLPLCISARNAGVPRLELPSGIVSAPLANPLNLKMKGTEAPVAKSRPESYEWAVAEGDWQYKSNYTGKTYPTAVRYYAVKSNGQPTDIVYIEMTNDLFGTAYLQTDVVTGDTRSLYYTDEEGVIVYPRLRDDAGNILDVAFSVHYLANSNASYGTWSSYPLSGCGRLMTRIIPIVDNEVNTDEEEVYYDYLYDTQATDNKIKAEYARGYYHGEKCAHVSLQRGKGVTDVYYIMGNEIVDEKRTLAEPTWNEDHWSYVRVRRNFADEYIAEFKSGATNDSYIVGRVDDNAREFDIPLPDCDGMRCMMIVACSGDRITDMVFDMLEIRRPQDWRTYGTVDLTQYMDWRPDGSPFTAIVSGTYPIEVNTGGTIYRIVNPFVTEEAPDANYLYVNASLGDNSCYLEPSYAPLNICYEYQALDGTKQSMTCPYIMKDIISSNILHGFKAEQLKKIGPEEFMDFSDGFFNDPKSIASDYNTQIYDAYEGWAVMINHSAYGRLMFKLHSGVSATPYVKGVSFEVGSAVDYLLCSFGYDTTSPSLTAARAADATVFRIDIINSVGNIDIQSLLANNEIPQSPARIFYTAYDAAGNVLREGDLDLSDYSFTKKTGECNVTYIDGSSYGFNDAQLQIIRDDNNETGISEFVVEDFGSTMPLVSQDNVDISFQVDNSGLVNGPEDYFIGTFDFGAELGMLEMYAEFRRLSYVKTSDGAELRGELWYMCYTPAEHEFKGYYRAVEFKISIPVALAYNLSAVELPEIDSDTDAVPEYYNLQGIRVANPCAGQIYLMRVGDAVKKVIIR